MNDFTQTALLPRQAVFEWEHGRDRVFWIGSVESVMGQTAGELAKAPPYWREFIHPADHERVAQQLVEAELHNTDCHRIYRFRDRDGHHRWIHERSFASASPEGSPARRIGIVEDVTERRLLEARLRRAQRMDGVSALACSIAHDLSKVVSPILLAGELARDAGENPPKGPVLAILLASAMRGAALAREIHTFAHGAEGGLAQLATGPFFRKIDELVREALPRSIVFQLELDPSLRPIRANAARLRQAILNLSTYARDAMPDGGRLTLTAGNIDFDEVSARRMPGALPGPFIVVTVCDTGNGMPPDVADRIFEPFFTTKEAVNTSGLGLPAVHGIVKRHGGFLDVESTPGEGTRVHLYLPACPTAVGPASIAGRP